METKTFDSPRWCTSSSSESEKAGKRCSELYKLAVMKTVSLLAEKSDELESVTSQRGLTVRVLQTTVHRRVMRTSALKCSRLVLPLWYDFKATATNVEMVATGRPIQTSAKKMCSVENMRK